MLLLLHVAKGSDMDNGVELGPVMSTPSPVNDYEDDEALEAEEATPSMAGKSRSELLDAVRVYSENLLEPVSSGSAAFAAATGDKNGGLSFWRETFEGLFLDATPHLDAPKQQDDMLFFVRQKKDDEGQAPFFVRRWTPQLPKIIAADVGNGFAEKAASVDWRRSVYLNLIAHTSYALTVAVCSKAALDERRRSGATGLATSLMKVTKVVYASPSRLRVNMQSSKTEKQVPAYPDCCFSVFDYEMAFENVVVSEPDHCLCVILSARGGAALSDRSPSSSATTPVQTPDSARTPSSSGHSVTLFSGFVTYDKLREAFQGGRTRLSTLLSKKASSERVLMRGPGGRGEAEVAVTGVGTADLSPPPDDSPENSPVSSFTGKALFKQEEPQPQPQPAASSQQQGWGKRFEGAFNMLSLAAQNTARAMTAAAQPLVNSGNDMIVPRLQCCLMSVTLPWQSLAHDLLLKTPVPLPVEAS
eukprot:jgi/Chlat1/1710/Chrsp127S01930